MNKSTHFRSIIFLCAVIALWGCSSSENGSDLGVDASIRDSAGQDTGTDAAMSTALDVEVVITADNAYSFGYGDSSQINTFVQGMRSDGSEIFDCPVGYGPHQHHVPAADAPEGAYLYVVSWDDLAVTQGVIGQFMRGSDVLYTGDARFEVCATGIAYDTEDGPPLSEINTQIALCNSGAGDPSSTSSGWVNAAGAVTSGAVGTLAVGETNQSGEGTFRYVCSMDEAGVRGVDAEAQWMWYDPHDGLAPQGPFRAVSGQNAFRSFLIFRIAAADIVLF